MLTAQQVERYRWDGYLFPLPALSADELLECNAGLARFEDWLGAPLPAADKKWRSAGYVFLSWVAALVRHPRILDAVEMPKKEGFHPRRTLRVGRIATRRRRHESQADRRLLLPRAARRSSLFCTRAEDYAQA